MEIAKREQGVRKERIMTTFMWIFLVLLSTTFLVRGGYRGGETGLWLGVQACFWFLFGAVFLLRYFLNRNQLEGYFVPASAVAKIVFTPADPKEVSGLLRKRRSNLKPTLDYLKDK